MQIAIERNHILTKFRLAEVVLRTPPDRPVCGRSKRKGGIQRLAFRACVFRSNPQLTVGYRNAPGSGPRAERLLSTIYVFIPEPIRASERPCPRQSTWFGAPAEVITPASSAKPEAPGNLLQERSEIAIRQLSHLKME